jgi:hypothetical protein
MEELQFQVIVDPGQPALVDNTICFETGALVSQVGPMVYEHHGKDFNPRSTGALTQFFEDLICGTPLPLNFTTHEVRGPDTILAITLFLNRDLALNPATLGLVYGVDLVHRFGPSMLAHLDPTIAGFLRSFNKFFPDTLSKIDRGERIGTAVQWIREYLIDGRIPNIGSSLPEVRVLDVGTNGFVLAETSKPSVEAWEVLYRLGHLRGVLIGEPIEDSIPILGSRKSERAWPNLSHCIPFLNDLDVISGGVSGWRLDGDFVHSPAVGTKILVSHLLEVFLRI